MERSTCFPAVFGMPYGRRPAPYDTYYLPPYNPMEEVYRIALHYLEDSFERELMTINRFYPMEYDQRHYYYDLEFEARYRFEKAKNRLYDEFRYATQQYMYQIANRGYGYDGLRQSRWEWPAPSYDAQLIPYQYTYTYLNTKEITTPMPTETKSYIITNTRSEDTEVSIYYAENNEDFKSLNEAEKEAQKLARENPTDEFTIYATVKSYKVADKPVDVKVFV